MSAAFYFNEGLKIIKQCGANYWEIQETRITSSVNGRMVGKHTSWEYVRAYLASEHKTSRIAKQRTT